jgi:uncharacterized membrane protein
VILFAVFSPALAATALAAAVGTPLLIHLLFRKRYQIVPWAAIRFLVVAERRHRRRIDQWVLLTLRVLALVLPLFGMAAATRWAEPLWQSIKPGAMESIANVPRTHHVIVLDASLSMQARPEGGPSRFEKAIAQAERLIRSGGPGDGYTVLALSAVRPVGVGHAGDSEMVIVPGPSNEPEKVIGVLRKIKPTHAPADTAAILPTVADIVTRSPRGYPRRQVTFLTDLQKSSWANVLPKADGPPPEVWQRIDSRADVVVVDVARLDAPNLAVTDIALIDPLPMVDTPGVVVATVANFSSSEALKVRAQLLIGRPSSGSEALVPLEQQVIEVIPPNERGKITFGLEGQLRFREMGLHVLQVKLMQADELVEDDVRSMAVQVRDGLHAILVDGSADPVPSRRAAGYLSRALYPPGIRPSDTAARPRTLTPGEFADPALGDLTGIDCVYLCDVPNPTGALAAKLEALLRRGGGVVIGFGPNSAASKAEYNSLFFNDGKGILPGPLGEVAAAGNPNDLGYRLAASEEAYRHAPLREFRDEKIRSGLVNVPFHSYIRLDVPADGRAQRILSFVPASATAATKNLKVDPALVEWKFSRGRSIVFTSSFNGDWNDWPPLQSYLPFQNELLQYAAASPDRHTILVGEAIEEFYPTASVGHQAILTGPEGLSVTLPVRPEEEGGVVRFADTRLSGIYRLRLDGAAERTFVANAPEGSSGGGSEFDLRRIDPADWKKLLDPNGTAQIVQDVSQVVPSSDSGATLFTSPKPHGPMIARIAVLVALVILVLEMLMAWRWGPARSGSAGTRNSSLRPGERKWLLRVLSDLAASIPLLVAVLGLATLIHYERTGNLLGFLSGDVRHRIEEWAGVPMAQPGEGTRWRLESFTVFVRNGLLDKRILSFLALAAAAFTFFVYSRERRAGAGIGRLLMPALLRCTVFLLALLVVLPQLRLAFDREGWPEVVILLDTSASMSTTDQLRDPAVRAKAEELVGASALPQTHRLRLAQALLTRKNMDWLDRLLQEKEVKVHIYTVDSSTRPVASMEQSRDAAEARDTLDKLVPNGESSRLGEGVENVLKAYQGTTLAGIIMFTDGVTTAGDDLPRAGREASRAGVPLYLVGMGDAWETPDVLLMDMQVEDTVTVGDRLVFDARLLSRGQVPTEPLPVVLYEKIKGQLVERARVSVTPNSHGTPVPVTLAHTPHEAGEKVFVLAAASVAGETDLANNKLERTVLVTDAKRIRVLYIEGYPRYDYRFVKVLLERESERSAGGKGVEIQVVLLDAARRWAETDRSAFRGEVTNHEFPTGKDLLEYDVIILGDIQPKQLPRTTRTLQEIADFVRVKGGGLLFLSGEHGTPRAFAETPLAEVLPVTTDDPVRNADEGTTEPFQPRITELGRQHPLFRFSPDPGESAKIWNRLPPLCWHARGYRAKPNTSVLAVHPTRPAEGGKPGELQPLVIQSHVGAGPVLFLGFDDTWRWRFRTNEEHFDRFWIQVVRVLSRSRTRRVELKISPKTDFRKDEQMTVTVRFPAESPAPPAGQPVRVTLSRMPLTRPDGTPGPGPTETLTLTLGRLPGPGAVFTTTLNRTPEGEYRFTLTDPEPQAGTSAPTAVARVLPPWNERDRVELNKSDLAAAAALSSGCFYTLATADNVFEDLKNLQRVPLNQPCPPVEIWNDPALYLLILSLLTAEWLLRKRERLL